MIARHKRNPILTRADIPAIPPHLSDVTSVFNPGAVKVNDEYLLMLRVQSRSRETSLLVARSPDGVHFTVSAEAVHFKGIEKVRGRIYHVYDPRITRLGDSSYIMVALDMDNACHLGLAVTADFRSFEFLGLTSTEDIRNGVLFPEQVAGKYLRMDRPNKARLEGGPTTGNTIWLSESDDLLHWRARAPVRSAE